MCSVTSFCKQQNKKKKKIEGYGILIQHCFALLLMIMYSDNVFVRIIRCVTFSNNVKQKQIILNV